MTESGGETRGDWMDTTAQWFYVSLDAYHVYNCWTTLLS